QRPCSDRSFSSSDAAYAPVRPDRVMVYHVWQCSRLGGHRPLGALCIGMLEIGHSLCLAGGVAKPHYLNKSFVRRLSGGCVRSSGKSPTGTQIFSFPGPAAAATACTPLLRSRACRDS